MAQVELWNRRAGFLLRTLDERAEMTADEAKARLQEQGISSPSSEAIRHEIEIGRPSPIELARATLARWRRLVATVPNRALSAAAHQGLVDGAVAAAVRRLRRGCLTLAGTPGGGKTVGAAWLAYHGASSVLWLDAVAVGQAHPDEIGRLRREISVAGLVVLDDLGAGSSTGDWSSRKVADVLTTILERQDPSVVAMNLDRPAFRQVMDGGDGGRLDSRLSMPPNIWIDIVAKDRRPGASEPPKIEVLPERETKAHALVHLRTRILVAHHALAMGDVDVGAMKSVAKDMGFARWRDVDEAIDQHERSLADVRSEMDRLAARMRLAVPPPEKESDRDEPVPGEQQRKRVALLDLVANVAEQRGVDERHVLNELGRTRRTISGDDEQRLVAMLTGGIG